MKNFENTSIFLTETKYTICLLPTLIHYFRKMENEF